MGVVDVRIVQELLGHKDNRMTIRSSRLASYHMKNAVMIIDSHYLETKGSEKGNQGAASQA
jgi:hypothetical protein